MSETLQRHHTKLKRKKEKKRKTKQQNRSCVLLIQYLHRCNCCLCNSPFSVY